MDIEKEPNIFSSSSTSPSNKSIFNSENYFQQNSLNMILNTLIKKYSLNEVIKSIVFSTTLNQINLENNKNEPDLQDIINQIYKEVGPVKIIQTILELQVDENDINIINNKNKKITKNSGKKEEVFIDINKIKNNENRNDKNPKINDTKNIFNLSSENTDEDNNDNAIIINDNSKPRNTKTRKNNNNNNNDLIIDINDKYIDNSNVINLSESSNDSNYTIEIASNSKSPSPNKNIINLGKKSFKKNILPLKETSKINTKGNNTTKRKYNLHDISYHCSNIEGIYYKYKKDKFINQSKNLIRFKCYNPKCESWGIYDASDKTFTLQKLHWVDNTIHCYDKYMNEQDKKNHFYMKLNGVNELQMYKDEQ